jgi:MFS family permease
VTSLLALVCLLTFLHFVAAQMRTPVLPLYAVAHGATATGVGLIMGAHMAVAAVASMPLGRASDVWGRRPLLLAGMAVGVITSLSLPLFEGELALALIFGLAGLGIAAFTPSVLSLVGDAAAPGAAGRAYGWYATAHYGAIAMGPLIGGVTAESQGYRLTFVSSAVGIAVAMVVGMALPLPTAARVRPRPSARFADVRGHSSVWAAWIVSIGGLAIQGVVFTFLPLLTQERGFTPSDIGITFGVLGLANTFARFPAGWLMDRTGRFVPYAVGGVLTTSAATVVLPHVHGYAQLLALVAIFGAASGTAGVATGVGLVAATTPDTRGVVMGGYSTALYLGLALGSFAFGPVITRYGYPLGFAAGAAVGMIGAVIAGGLWTRGSRGVMPQRSRPRSRPGPPGAER